LKIFHPKLHIKEVQAIDLPGLKAIGIDSLIVDLDETLRKRNSRDIPERSIKWIEDVKAQGFKVCITSNNPFGWRMGNVHEKLKVPVSFLSFKPFPFAFWQAMQQLGSTPATTALVGDQVLTDILGANLLGIYTILVNPISGMEMGFFRRKMRQLENWILGSG
jgi:uncharacterized protein